MKEENENLLLFSANVLWKGTNYTSNVAIIKRYSLKYKWTCRLAYIDFKKDMAVLRELCKLRADHYNITRVTNPTPQMQRLNELKGSRGGFGFQTCDVIAVILPDFAQRPLEPVFKAIQKSSKWRKLKMMCTNLWIPPLKREAMLRLCCYVLTEKMRLFWRACNTM